MRVLGVDVWSKGWVGVELRDGRFAGARMGTDLLGLITACGKLPVIAVDIPLGLLDSGLRRADAATAALLGPRRSSVFPTPPRPVVAEKSYPAAAARHVELTGTGLSRQSFNLRVRLLEANELYDRGDFLLREVHPELSFATMGDGPAPRSKKTWDGQRDRIERLRSVGIELPDRLGAAGTVPTDDVLDAAAAAWTAHRIGGGVASSVPDPPEVNERGQQLAIWY
jgi:predicted RNase H-like nuclease